MSVQVKWFGHASFRIQADHGVLYIDPWKLPAAAHDADVIFVSHSHYDHCSKLDVDKASNVDSVLLAPADAIAKLGATNAITPGQEFTVKDIVVETVAAYNIGKTFHPRGHNWCGAVFSLGGKRIYYSGDTDLIPEMSDLKAVDLALLPVGGTYTLSADQAAAACKAIGCRAAVPYHWGDIVGTEQDAQIFARTAPCKVHLLKPGEAVTL